MTRRHDAVFDDVLSGLDEAPTGDAPQRYARRTSALAETASGSREEKILRLVDPATCRMWDGHNRAYDLLTPESCQDLIDGLLSQGQQEFPAIVRALPAGDTHEWEVICGARRHFAVSWLRDNTYPQFRYLIEPRELTDEEAFRLADIENRDREDISDLERARDYAHALEAYYGGVQKTMAERLKVSAGWLSRYLHLAKLPDPVVAAFGDLRNLRELHARKLKPFLEDPKLAPGLIAAAEEIAAAQSAGQEITAATVLARLTKAVAPPKERKAADEIIKTARGAEVVHVRKRGKRVQMEFPADLRAEDLRSAVEDYLRKRGN